MTNEILTKMDFYRNYNDLISMQGIPVDAGSLWRKQGQLMVLVDDDQYVTHAYEEAEFYEEKKV
ncbi:hypothetical protein [Chryseobacterium luquanense]|nr:hypothetical protein [Chryseobacterium luquanense]